MTVIRLPCALLWLCAPQAAFEYMKGLQRSDVEAMLLEAQLAGLTDVIMLGVESLQDQSAASGKHLHEKFKSTGKFMMGCE